ncbi:bactofilin family protein [Amphiplicatus metriothermophilus]|uniref:Protein CcmA, bactofilin family n=1 Tax=Amphiplicatus metriothermophilus TaxID=1519374 RepID=A0A239Q0G6_9PROT|nr:polymer-forming cytoskeletal protein [Amphiplicatus metriothermophilus]MBB5520169.1 cytoskeletal protein CcmA (bactofilin family) [Amphiplicatus metriothermophilus]SNT75920.1 protein CcmA, bactofilin family [Amphiplicatus metriothermophilus]
MFSKAKAKHQQEEKSRQAGPETAQVAATPPQPKRSSPMKTAGVPSIISADVVMRGNINSSGEIQFDGSLEGDIKASSLIIGEKASVKGEVVCETVMVRGRVEGGIRAKSVSLASTAHIQGDILHSSLSVESGAHFEGNCRHSDDPLSEAAAKDFRKARPTGVGAPAPRPMTTGPEEEANLRAANETPSFLSQNRSPLR